MIVTGNDLEKIQSDIDALYQNFKLKDLGELRYFTEIEFARSSEGILMSQRKYALEMICEVGLTKPKETPMEQNLKLTNTEFDELVKAGGSNELLEDRNSFQRLVRKLLFLTITRPEIVYAVQCLN